MKQYLEISNVKFDAEKNQTSFSETRYNILEDGSKELKFTRDNATVDGQPDMLAYGQTLIEPGQEIEVTLA